MLNTTPVLSPSQQSSQIEAVCLQADLLGQSLYGTSGCQCHVDWATHVHNSSIHRRGVCTCEVGVKHWLSVVGVALLRRSRATSRRQLFHGSSGTAPSCRPTWRRC